MSSPQVIREPASESFIFIDPSTTSFPTVPESLKRISVEDLIPDTLVYHRRASIHQKTTAREIESGYAHAFYPGRIIIRDGISHFINDCPMPTFPPRRLYHPEGTELQLSLLDPNEFYILRN